MEEAAKRSDLKQVDGAAAGAWIEPALGGGFGGSVASEFSAALMDGLHPDLHEFPELPYPTN